MTIDAVEIRDSNIEAHLDIEKELQNLGTGLFTFILRINSGNVVDFNVVEYVDIAKYLRLKSVVIQELNITRSVELGDTKDPVRTDNSQRTST